MGQDRDANGDQKDLERVMREALEKRRYERFKAGLQVKFRVVGPTEEATLVKSGSFTAPEAVQAATPEVQDIHKVLGEDISLGGLRITTPYPLSDGTRLWLQVSIPGIPMAVNAVGEVRWSRRSGSLCSSGLKFNAISKDDLAKVERFLALRQNLGA